jgi:pimeloyl-ACP methyl ester carboxylesterase
LAGRLRRLDESKYPVTSFADEAAFMDADELPAGCLTFEVNGVPVDILNSPAPGAASTIVVFHPAVTEAVETLPFFSGQTVTKGAPAHRVWIQDPTLYLDDRLKLSWFAGNRKMDVQGILTRVVAKLLSVHGSKHAIFFGASGGGFAAMYYSRQFPDSLAVAINPQTNIRRYGKTPVKQYLEYGLGARPGSEPSKIVEYPIASDLTREYRQGFPNTVAYVQNAGDKMHVERHLKGFLRVLPGHPRMMLHIGDWGRGHIAPDKDFLQALIVASVNCFGDWAKLAALGFQASPDLDFVDDRIRQLKEGPAPEPSAVPAAPAPPAPLRRRAVSYVRRRLRRIRQRLQ